MFAYSALHVHLGSRKVNTMQHASTEPFLITHIYLSTPVPHQAAASLPFSLSRKAFDSLEWPFIMKILDAFNFGSIKRWISTFYTNVESAVLNNGRLTNWFKPSKGVRQGCLFILSAEVMSIKIRFDPGVKGINLFGSELKLSQFANDTNLFCADLISIEKALNIVNDFGRIAGLQLNMKKKKRRFGLESGRTIKPTPWT